MTAAPMQPLPSLERTRRFTAILARLEEMSVRDYYNPYRTFDWPDTIPADEHWMSRTLLSIHGTEVESELSEEQVLRLSRWESVNFYSLNVHGIRELLTEVIRRIHTSGFEIPSEFFHHFVGEENEHMWFFATFCLRYAGKIYPDRTIESSAAPAEETPVNTFMVFARILLFEEIVDHFNVAMADDESLHETIRQMNRIHHQDESRHITFGRKLVSFLWEDLRPNLNDEQRAAIEQYVKRYLNYSITSFYNPLMYKDAGLDRSLELRQRLLTHQSRKEIHRQVLHKPLGFLLRKEILRDDDFESVLRPVG